MSSVPQIPKCSLLFPITAEARPVKGLGVVSCTVLYHTLSHFLSNHPSLIFSVYVIGNSGTVQNRAANQQRRGSDCFFRFGNSWELREHYPERQAISAKSNPPPACAHNTATHSGPLPRQLAENNVQRMSSPCRLYAQHGVHRIRSICRHRCR